jgi:hypothetical protein
MTCGCRRPYDDHGDARNITKDEFTAAGKTAHAGGKTVGGTTSTAVRTHRITRRKRR